MERMFLLLGLLQFAPHGIFWLVLSLSDHENITVNLSNRTFESSFSCRLVTDSLVGGLCRNYMTELLQLVFKVMQNCMSDITLD